MNYKKTKVSAFCLVTAISSQAAVSASSSSLQDEEIVGQQISRTTSSHISSQIMNKVLNASFSGNSTNKASASSDSNTYMPDTFWGMTSISSITEESSNINIPDFDTDIYQFTGGFDKRHDDLFYGMSLSYAYTENETGAGNDSTMHTVGVTPYVAYKVNDYLFLSGLASYYYTHHNAIWLGALDLDNHRYEFEGNINFFKVIDSFVFKARTGVRYQHSNSSVVQKHLSQEGVDLGFGFVTPTRDNTYDELTWIADGEVGYRFDNGITLFTGALYEHYDREGSSTSNRLRDNIVLMRYGIDYPVSESFTLGAKIENDLNDEDRDYFTGSLNIRLEI